MKNITRAWMGRGVCWGRGWTVEGGDHRVDWEQRKDKESSWCFLS